MEIGTSLVVLESQLLEVAQVRGSRDDLLVNGVQRTIVEDELLQVGRFPRPAPDASGSPSSMLPAAQ